MAKYGDYRTYPQNYTGQKNKELSVIEIQANVESKYNILKKKRKE
jgi:hypothetical protein